MLLRKRTAALVLAVFSAAACTQGAADTENTPSNKTETAYRAPDRDTADCIDAEMDRMFSKGELKDLNPPEKSYSSYTLQGEAYKAVAAACEKQTGQKTLFPGITGQTSHRPKPCLPDTKTVYPHCRAGF